MVSSIVAVLASLVPTYAFLRVLLAYTQDDNEPEAPATSIPFLNPLLGMARKAQFYTDLRCVFPHANFLNRPSLLTLSLETNTAFQFAL